MGYHNLTNEEIVFLYYMSWSVVKQYEDTVADKTLTQTLPTEKGSVEVTIGLPGDIIEAIKGSRHFIIMKAIHRKLKPIFEMIQEVEPEIVKSIDELFNHKPK